MAGLRLIQNLNGAPVYTSVRTGSLLQRFRCDLWTDSIIQNAFSHTVHRMLVVISCRSGFVVTASPVILDIDQRGRGTKEPLRSPNYAGFGSPTAEPNFTRFLWARCHPAEPNGRQIRPSPHIQARRLIQLGRTIQSVSLIQSGRRFYP